MQAKKKPKTKKKTEAQLKKEKDRKQNGGGGHFLYRKLRKENYPPGFQVLCYNCNFAKGIWGKCPHKQS